MTREEYRDKNSLIPAVRDTGNGKVWIGKRTDIHATIDTPGASGEGIESGWTDDAGNYISYADAAKIQGNSDSRRTWSKITRDHEAAVTIAVSEGKPVPPEVLADYPDLKPNVTPKIPDPRTLEQRITAKIDEINRRRKNSPGIPRGDNTGGTILFAELVDLVHEIALRAVRAGVRGADNIGKIFDELTAGKDPEIQTLRKDIIDKAERYVSEWAWSHCRASAPSAWLTSGATRSS
jgi:hypothetical protein